MLALIENYGGAALIGVVNGLALWIKSREMKYVRIFGLRLNILTLTVQVVLFVLRVVGYWLYSRGWECYPDNSLVYVAAADGIYLVALARNKHKAKLSED